MPSNAVKEYFRNLNPWEWILFIGGILAFGKIVMQFLTDTLEYSMLNGVALTVSVLCFSAPKALSDIIKHTFKSKL